jgi:hypothetical protein
MDIIIKFVSVNHFYNSFSANKEIQVKNTVNASTKLVSGIKLMVHAHRFAKFHSSNLVIPRIILHGQMDLTGFIAFYCI